MTVDHPRLTVTFSCCVLRYGLCSILCMFCYRNLKQVIIFSFLRNLKLQLPEKSYSLKRSIPFDSISFCRICTSSSLGVHPDFALRAAAMPTASPIAMQMDITL